MSNTSQVISAKNLTSEEQLNKLLENCGISSLSPNNVEGLSHWWKKEFEPNLPPLARQIVIAGDENFTRALCVAVEDGKFIIYMFNERNFWFDRLSEFEGAVSADELKAYLKKLVDQYHIDWKKLMKENRP